MRATPLERISVLSCVTREDKVSSFRLLVAGEAGVHHRLVELVDRTVVGPGKSHCVNHDPVEHNLKIEGRADNAGPEWPWTEARPWEVDIISREV